MARGAVRHRTPKVPPRPDPWWRSAVLYQIWPRSFFDSNGDGIGDLPGIAARLDHLARLGVDAVWISPFYRSPMKDYGYDIEDYCDVDPTFGNLADFDALLARAHELGLRVLVDLVPSHTSNRHPWFLESRESRDNPRADWYVWADPKPDGMPPNNWISIFGGVAWEWEPRRQQYYLHNFLKEQPDLNFHEPGVIRALLDVARFWLERGVDGFRIDAIEFGVHDPKLRNNPPRPPGSVALAAAPGSPYGMQLQKWNKARPELNDLFLKPLWRLSHEYGAKVLLGEITGDRAVERIAGHTTGGGLDLAYGFELLIGPITAAKVRRAVEHMWAHLDGGWISWSFSNHDVVRGPSRLGRVDPPEAARALLPVLLCCLRGTPCLYQGDELGLEEALLAFEDLHDPFGITFWPAIPGRDGCRTPIPWQADAPHGGFTTGTPWLRFYEPHRARAADRQVGVEGSVFERLRSFLAFRRSQPALQLGDIRFADLPEPLLLFTRSHEGRSLLCAFNMGDDERIVTDVPAARILWEQEGPAIDRGRLVLPPWSVAVADSGDGE